MSTPRGIQRVLARSSAPPVAVSLTGGLAGLVDQGPEPVPSYAPTPGTVLRTTPTPSSPTERAVGVQLHAATPTADTSESTANPSRVPAQNPAVAAAVTRTDDTVSEIAQPPRQPGEEATLSEPQKVSVSSRTEQPPPTDRVDSGDDADTPPHAHPVALEPAAPSTVRIPAEQPDQLSAPERPEPVVPVQIGRIEVQVAAPAAVADPFAGLREVADGLTARRGGGW